MIPSMVQLWNKFQNSGINGAPVITDMELGMLQYRLADMRDFLKQENLAYFQAISDESAVARIIENRKNK